MHFDSPFNLEMSFGALFGRKQLQSPTEGIEEIVSKLIATLKSCTQIQDRRNCIQNVLGYAKKYPEIVASHGFAIYFGNLGVQDNLLILGTLETIEILLKESENCAKFLETLENDGNFQVLTALIQQPEANEEHSINETVLRILSLITKSECPRLCLLLMSDAAKALNSLTALLKNETDVVLVDTCQLLQQWSMSSLEISSFFAFDGLLDELAEMLFGKANLPNLIRGKYTHVHLLSLFVSLLRDNERNCQLFINAGSNERLSRILSVFSNVKTISQWNSSVTKIFGLLLECYSALLRVQSQKFASTVKEQCLQLNGFFEMLTVCTIEDSIPESIKIYVSFYYF
jgi:hypothetical protein